MQSRRELASCSTEVPACHEIRKSAWQVSDERCYRWTKVSIFGIAKTSVKVSVSCRIGAQEFHSTVSNEVCNHQNSCPGHSSEPEKSGEYLYSFTIASSLPTALRFRLINFS
jgi:hypothetical protein